MPLNQIAKISTYLLENLVSNYTENYIREITPEVARLCSILTETSPQGIRNLLKGIKTDSINIRRTCANLLYLEATQSNDLLTAILNEMLLTIPTENKFSSLQYF